MIHGKNIFRLPFKAEKRELDVALVGGIFIDDSLILLRKKFHPGKAKRMIIRSRMKKFFIRYLNAPYAKNHAQAVVMHGLHRADITAPFRRMIGVCNL